MVKAALIVARDGSGLRPVFGIPAARRLVLLARQLGLGAIHLFGRDPSLYGCVSDLIPAEAFHTVTDPSELGPVTEGLGLDRADQALVMQASHVVDRWSLQKLVQAAGAEDLSLSGNDGEGSAEGSEPIRLARADLLAPLLCAMWSPGPPPAHSTPPGRRVSGAGGLPVLLRGGAHRTKSAERALLSALGVATAGTDSFLARAVHRPISRFITRGLAKTPTTPNMVTLFNIAVGLAGAFFLAKGTYAAQVLGAFLFVASTILDGVDGEMARLKLRESNFGHYLDIGGDNVVHVAVFFGISLGLYGRTSDPVYLWALGLLLGGFGLCALAVQRVMGHGPEKEAQARAPFLAALLVNRDFAYLVLLLALLHRLGWFLFGTTAGVYLFALILFVTSLRETRAKASGNVRRR